MSAVVLVVRPGRSARPLLPSDGLSPLYGIHMKKALITRNQRRFLDGLCERWTFDQQVDWSQEIWPGNYSYIRKSYSRLQNLGFLEWISQEQTSYEPRWWVTEKGVRYLLDND